MVDVTGSVVLAGALRVNQGILHIFSGLRDDIQGTARDR
jgi:hypothetical protein